MENTIKQLKKFRFEAVCEKKKHYNAAERKCRINKILAVIQIVINAIAGTSLVTSVLGSGNKYAEIVALCLTISATILAGVQKSCDFANQAQGNKKVADMYLKISKKINVTLNLIKDNSLNQQEIVSKVEVFCNDILEVQEIASQFSTNKRDYRKAQKGIANGEENYTEDDLNVLE